MMKPVSSSNIRAIGYDPASKRLSVQFNGSGTYHYDDVPPEAHEHLMSEETGIGSRFHSNASCNCSLSCPQRRNGVCGAPTAFRCGWDVGPL